MKRKNDTTCVVIGTDVSISEGAVEVKVRLSRGTSNDLSLSFVILIYASKNELWSLIPTDIKYVLRTSGRNRTSALDVCPL